MIRIVADDRIPFLQGVLEKVAEVSYLPGNTIKQSDLKDADCLITRTRTRCDRALLEHTNVRLIASATIGFDHIDTGYCRAAGISWTNAPGCNASSVQQYMASVWLHLATWMGFTLEGRILGVVGAGHVGSPVAEAAEALGMQVLLNDPPRKRAEKSDLFMELDEVLAQADIITLHVPLNRGGMDNTLGMVDRRFVEQMRKGSILINTSRGEVIRESGLMEGIRGGRLAGVVLDVFSGEPEIDRKLLDAITIGTPHIAGYSLDGKAGGTTMSVRAVSRFFKLGLDHWSPAYIPSPEQPEIRADASGKDHESLLWEVYRQTYDVTADDRRLREDPGAFEKLRAAYPPRREPPAYSVCLAGGKGEDWKVWKVLEKLGFVVEREIPLKKERHQNNMKPK
ncbi:MAG TPA: 4-phosphoerythronate dehydrogenase [Bacteroides sp.]|nr:4-phosphoerythronate dehydrogenase [Bacteroides sp.]